MENKYCYIEVEKLKSYFEQQLRLQRFSSMKWNTEQAYIDAIEVCDNMLKTPISTLTAQTYSDIEIPNFKRILKETPLETRLFVYLQMDDYDNWDNGSYKGDNQKIKEKVTHIIGIMESFLKDSTTQIASDAWVDAMKDLMEQYRYAIDSNNETLGAPACNWDNSDLPSYEKCKELLSSFHSHQTQSITYKK